MNTPIPYSADVERAEPDEAETTQGLVETLLKISQKVVEDGHHAMRSVHAKSHALLRGTLAVDARLPTELSQGVFASERHYPVMARLSSTPGDVLKDSVSTPRGLALKLFEVPGTRLPDAAGRTQDFIFANGPAFNAPDAKHFLKSLKLLAGTTDKAPNLKAALSLALRGTERVVEALGGASATIKSLGGHPATHPLGETYFTQVPLRYGAYVAKLRLVPASSALKALTNASVNIRHDANALRDLVREFFRNHDGAWEVQVQLCRDLEQMPVENSAKIWSEDLSPYQRVGELSIPKQDAWPDTTERVEDGLSFSPWHGIDEHRPLGSINRVRKSAYAASAKFRAAHNKVSVMEPESPITGE